MESCSARLGATVIVIIVIGVYEGHGNSLLIPFLESIGPKRRLDLPVLRTKVDAEAADDRQQPVISETACSTPDSSTSVKK